MKACFWSETTVAWWGLAISAADDLKVCGQGEALPHSQEHFQTFPVLEVSLCF